MPFIKRSGASSEVDQDLKSKRQQIIEEERIRVLKESLMLFYDKLMEKYELIHPRSEEEEIEGVDTDLTTLRITQSWLNRIEPQSYHPMHNHKNSYLSGILYIKCIWCY